MNVLSLTYLGNIRWFSKLCFSECVIDLHEHYVKQSFRNRCEILSPAGRTTLTVNVAKGRNDDKTAVRDTRIDYSKRWQHQHRQALVSAYANAPYFDHYWPEIEPFYTKRFDFLADLNISLAATILRLIGSDARLRFSDAYIEPGGNFNDLRDAISPKPRLNRPDPLFRPEPYWQVFPAEKDGFEADLSVVDLLFCEGPGALSVIRNSIPGAIDKVIQYNIIKMKKKNLTIALVAHDNMKVDLAEWVDWNCNLLMRYNLVCTGTTGRMVAKTLADRHGNFEKIAANIKLLKSGPLGGDQQLGAMIAEGKIYALFFFWDPMEAQPHDVDVKALLRLATLYNIPIAVNRSTADFIVSSPLFEGDYEPVVKDYKNYIERVLK